ncbi:hypothetical protein N0V83_002864 [Neocucurbitaria cava]|uniref:Major facilitator superfamily (MFS) profile domain-containing protein n=1 Tax=Neocucurbitaria cava TaxID=798079 RepID=A0A9W8YEH0_9PLEO|nr:hypothetical protein N0V83_002864 [Neocucurbitaria cava]
MAPDPNINIADSSGVGLDGSNNGTGIAIFPGVRSGSVEELGTYDPVTDIDTELEQEDFSNKKERHFGDYGPQDGGQDAEIVWEYLTFETELPHPTTIHPTQTGQELPPEPPNLVKFTNPFDWSEKRKNFTVWISCVITALTAFSAGSYSPGVGQMTEEWGVSNVAALVGITTFTTGFAVAPMVLAPFSEINGRRPVFLASGVLFVICQLCTGLTRSYAGMLVVRFLTGVGGSTFSTMVGGVVADIYHAEHRNTPMALFSGSALFGTGWGPLVSGFIAQNTTWRWIFYMQTIMCAMMVALICVIFNETRGSVLLSKKAKTLNKWYEARESLGYYGVNVSNPEKPGTTVSQRIRWKVRADEERSSLAKLIGISLYRPFHLLFTEPVVFWFSLWVAFSWAILYLTLAAIPLVFQHNHGFSLEQANAVFAAMCIGSMIATVLSIYQEKIARKYGKLVSTPEGRLYFACVESACMPIGLFMFGWTSFQDIHWIAPAIAVTIATIGIFAIYLSTFNYLADTYHRYASSALAAQSFCRNILEEKNEPSFRASSPSQYYAHRSGRARVHDEARTLDTKARSRPSKQTKHKTQAESKASDRPKSEERSSQKDLPKAPDLDHLRSRQAENPQPTNKLKIQNRTGKHSNSSDHRKHRRPQRKETKECIICTDTRSLHRFPNRPPTTQCTHEVDTCRRCLRKWIQSEFTTKIWNEINCPICSKRLQHSDMREFAPRDVFRRYDKLSTRAALEAIPNFRWCIAKGCKSGQVQPPGVVRFRCIACKKSHCVEHNVAWHKRETCKEYDYRTNKRYKKEEEVLSKKLILETTKKCPGCKRSIEKSYGFEV